MKLLNFLYDAVVLYVGSGFFSLWFPFLVALFFVALVPRLFRILFVWR